jgi:hypothetical protein
VSDYLTGPGGGFARVLSGSPMGAGYPRKRCGWGPGGSETASKPLGAKGGWWHPVTSKLSDRLSDWTLPYPDTGMASRFPVAVDEQIARTYNRAMSSAPTRKTIAASIKREVLTEAGYRCAVPTCRTILAIDLHHLVRVADGGRDEAANLLALCPTCHALHHRGIIHAESIRVWKGLLVALNEGIGRDAKDLLLLLSPDDNRGTPTWFSADGVLRFAGLIVAGLVKIGEPTPTQMHTLSWIGTHHSVYLSEKGTALVAAWKHGNQEALEAAQIFGASPIKPEPP